MGTSTDLYREQEWLPAPGQLPCERQAGDQLAQDSSLLEKVLAA